MSEKTFEDAMSRIQDIVSKLERGDVQLQEATTLFEEGLTLINFCEQQLNQFSEKVAQLKESNQENDDGLK